MFELVVVLLLLLLFTLAKGIRIVPQGEEWVVERLGKYKSTLLPGLNLIIPFIDSVRQRVSTRDIILDIPQQEVITRDNAVIVTNAVAFIKVTNPKNAVYGVEDVNLAIRNLVMTTLRSIIGGMELDEALGKREEIKAKLKESILDDVSDWGTTVKGVEIQDINPSQSMTTAMEKQVAAERERRAVIARAEGDKRAAILEAEGKLEAAKKEADAQRALAQASSDAMKMIADGIGDKELPAYFLIGDRYIDSLNKLSHSDNSKVILYPADIMKTVGELFKKA